MSRKEVQWSRTYTEQDMLEIPRFSLDPITAQAQLQAHMVMIQRMYLGGSFIRLYQILRKVSQMHGGTIPLDALHGAVMAEAKLT